MLFPRPLRTLAVFISCALALCLFRIAPVEGAEVESPSTVARRFAELAAKGDPAALSLVAERERHRYEQGYPATAKAEWGAPAGYASSSYPEVMGEFSRGDWSFVILRRVLAAEKDTAKREKAAHEKKIAGYFPADQQAAAKKTVFWRGDSLHAIAPVFLKRKDEGFPWMVLGGEVKGAPLPSFRAAMMRKWRCNLLRWTEGEAGHPVGDFVFGEKPEIGPQHRAPEIRCMDLRVGAPCGLDGQECYDLQGNPCAGTPDEQKLQAKEKERRKNRIEIRTTR
ncbi:MAG: hypothetical protein AB1405_14270 [Bdellovibrionota bacterium]